MALASDAKDFVQNIVSSIKEFNCCNDACTNCIGSTNIKEILQIFQGIDEITYSKWVRKNNFYQKVEFTESGTVVSETLDEIITKTFKLHVYNIFQQFSELKYLKKSLKNNEVILSVDFSYNYENKQRHKIQSPYFGHEAFTVFTAACNIKDSLSVVHDINLTVDKDIGLNVIPAAIISNQTLHEKI